MKWDVLAKVLNVGILVRFWGIWYDIKLINRLDIANITDKSIIVDSDTKSHTPTPTPIPIFETLIFMIKTIIRVFQLKHENHLLQKMMWKLKWLFSIYVYDS